MRVRGGGLCGGRGKGAGPAVLRGYGPASSESAGADLGESRAFCGLLAAGEAQVNRPLSLAEGTRLASSIMAGLRITRPRGGDESIVTG